MPSRARRPLAALACAVALLVVPTGARAQQILCGPDDIEVRRLDFAGNEKFSNRELADSVVTAPSTFWRRLSRLPGGRRCLDEAELERDELRLAIFYRKHGFYKATIDSEVRPLGGGRADVRFLIREGPPVMLDSLSITGFSTPGDSARFLRGLELRTGRRFDRYELASAINAILARLRNNGYPNADVLLYFAVDTTVMSASLELDVVTGALARIDTVRVRVEPADGRAQQISHRAVRRLVGFGEGDIYRERDLVSAQRNLYQLDAFRHVEVRLARGLDAQRDSAVAIDVSVIEGDMHAARVGVGFATLDCFRTQGEYTDRNFMGGGRRLELTGRLSKIGVADGARFASRLCGDLGEDPFSDELNYFAGVTFRQPTLFGLGPRTIPSISLYSERRSEYKVYRRSTPIGALATLTREPWPRTPATLTYQVERGRTEAQPALFCAVFTICERGDQEQLQSMKRLAVVSAALVRDRTDNPFNPTVGSVARLELRHASPVIGSSPELRFNKWIGDVAWYWEVGAGNVLAARVRAGGVLDPGLSLDGASEFIPPQERLYAGGPNTVRGFHQNELGPVVYVVDRYDTVTTASGEIRYTASPETAGEPRTVPTGGNSLVVANVEYRMRSPLFPNLLQWTIFTDVGEVWNRDRERGIDFERLKWTPGAGVRVFTFVGAIRVDVGYNPYRRPFGAAYFDATDDETGIAPLYCVSPGNDLAVTPGAPGGPAIQEPGECPRAAGRGGFQPLQERGFLRRLTFNFSIGQAF